MEAPKCKNIAWKVDLVWSILLGASYYLVSFLTDLKTAIIIAIVSFVIFYPFVDMIVNAKVLK